MDDPPDDDIAKRLIEGDAYEQTEVAVRRMVPLSLDTKILIAIGSLALSTTIAPAVLVRRDLVRSLEGTGSLDITLGVLALNGVVTAFVAGLVLVRQQRVVRRCSIEPAQARKLIRIEDFLTLFVILGGLFVLVSTGLALAGLVSPGGVETLYDYDIHVYQLSEAVSVDVRLVSGIGGLFAVALFGLWQLLT